ncbi:Alpha-galactosidase [Lacticaseibacillus rhamnosus LRHMDP3]|uniref:Alpha-galactosidase n=1 Tax=Lacticaseibacillus rhamnosus LRHMDP3 TaxID=1203259 RepID=A0AB33XQN2_LACRH|nr:Alpha-galactosidase [Lacticaseibacillus rhamnosus LRHMDP3]
MPITRSPAQKPACKYLSRNGQSPAITAKATYTPVSNRAGSRSNKKRCCLEQATPFLSSAITKD